MELFKGAVIVILIGLVLRVFVFLPYKVKTTAMENTLLQGDFLLTNQLAYRSESPQQGDLIVFEHPFKPGELTAGRVIATEGQTVNMVNKVVYADNQPVDYPYNVKFVDEKIISANYSNRDNIASFQVPAGALYVLSDNRDTGEDSRNYGFVNIDNVKGKGLFVYWSWPDDPNAPKLESPYVTPAITLLFYNLFHFSTRVNWERLGAAID